MTLKCFFINGNIGSGKTTTIMNLCESFKNRGYKALAAYEPVEKWRESGMLEKLYKGHVKEFQWYCLKTKIEHINNMFDLAKKEEYDFLFIESSPAIDLNVYSRALLNFEDMCDFSLYWKIEMLNFKINIKTTPNILLNIDPNICLQRINKRGRKEEKEISLSYIKKLHYLHLLNNENTPAIITNCDDFNLSMLDLIIKN